MKVLLFSIASILATLTVSAQTSEKIDYSQVKPKHFNELVDKALFTDKTSLETYKVVNREYTKGLMIQITNNGKSKFVKHGAFYKFNKGIKIELITYEYGKKSGLREVYNKNGVTNTREQYRNGKKDSLREEFNDEGKLVSEVPYSQGKKNGDKKSYYNGKLNFKTTYANGKKHGEALQYNTSTGKIVSRKTFNAGKKVGETILY
tara:strand:- start:551 stop:1165 length:615 start_codon:yes stop_codon:yes gene_type:complete